MIACKSQAALARQRCRIHTVREGVARCPLPSSSGGTSAESVEASKYSRVDQKPVRTKLSLTRSGDDRNVRSASRIALLRPGDLFICSGGVAHATLSVVAQVKGRAEEPKPKQRKKRNRSEASKDVSVTGYESLVSLHPRLAAA